MVLQKQYVITDYKMRMQIRSKIARARTYMCVYVCVYKTYI